MASYILNTNKNLPPVLLPSESYHLNPLDNNTTTRSRQLLSIPSRYQSISSASSPILSSSFSSSSTPPSLSVINSSITNDIPSPIYGNANRLPSPLPFSPVGTNKNSCSPQNPIILPLITTSFIDNNKNVLFAQKNSTSVPTAPPMGLSLINYADNSPLSSSIKPQKQEFPQTILPKNTYNGATAISSDTPRRVSVPLEVNQIILDFGTHDSGSPSSTSALENSSISFESFSSDCTTSKFSRSLSTSASSALSSSMSHKNTTNRRRHSSKLIVESFNDTIHNKLKKRQRNGPSCDNCRIKKIKCDAKIIILKKLNKNFVKPNKLITDFNPIDYGISKNEYLKTIEYYKVLNNDFEESGFTVFESGNNLIQFKGCTCCLNKKLSCEFTKGFTKADILEYNKNGK